MKIELLTKKSGHLAWCALIALLLAKQDGQLNSEAQENLFLIRWLATALKQHRFSREIAPDIEWLLKQGRTFGPRAKLRHKLDYIWRSCNGEMADQNDLFRLTYAMETAKDMGWKYRMLKDREWSGRNRLVTDVSINAVYVSRSSLDNAFDDNGMQILPLMAQLTGDIGAIVDIFNKYCWKTEPLTTTEDSCLYKLLKVKRGVVENNQADMINDELTLA